MPPIVLTIITFIELAIKAAPEIKSIAESAKTLISDLFSHGLITVDQQNQLHAHMDAIMTATLAGTLPPSWQVQADPKA